ncbi:MAG: GxxExxY protein [Gemmatimonadaceae bacterium]
MTSSIGRSDVEFQDGALTKQILVNFYEVYNELGRGFLESVYRTSLARALIATGLQVSAEMPINVYFRGEIAGRFYADLVVENRIVIEVKAVRTINAAHETQLQHYLRATTMEVGLLLNFGLDPQIKRIIYSNERKQSMKFTRENP